MEKHKALPQTPPQMQTIEELGYIPPEQRKSVAEKKALEEKPKVRRVRKVRRRKVASSRASAKSKASVQQPARPMPQQQQPRDRFGRFASFAGRAIVGTAKGIASVAKGTPKALKAADRIATNALQGMTGYQQNTRRTRRGR